MLKKLFVILLLFTSYVNAQDLNLNSACWKEAGLRYNVNPWLLYSVSSVESSHDYDATNKNTNGTVDIGMMQINSIWLKELKKYNIHTQHLYLPCININLGAWVLSQNIKKFGSNWQAIAAYNVGPNSSKINTIGLIYANKVIKKYQKYTGFNNVYYTAEIYKNM